MFGDIPRSMLDRMRQLEMADAVDRDDGTPPMERLRQIPPETGRFLAILAAGAPDGRVIEIGTSAGYSTLWLALACRASNRSITTFEILPDKAEHARETFRIAGVEDIVDLVPCPVTFALFCRPGTPLAASSSSTQSSCAFVLRPCDQRT